MSRTLVIAFLGLTLSSAVNAATPLAIQSEARQFVVDALTQVRERVGGDAEIESLALEERQGVLTLVLATKSLAAERRWMVEFPDGARVNGIAVRVESRDPRAPRAVSFLTPVDGKDADPAPAPGGVRRWLRKHLGRDREDRAREVLPEVRRLLAADLPAVRVGLGREKERWFIAVFADDKADALNVSSRFPEGARFKGVRVRLVGLPPSDCDDTITSSPSVKLD